MRRKILAEHCKIASAANDTVQHTDRLLRIRRDERIRNVKQKALLHAAENVVNIFRRYMVAAKRKALIRKRQRVAHSAVRSARDELETFLVDGRARAI
ncbi:unknown [Clostridium sp. CAG:1024]|nr:unknown [Clostridium sp. CAG:1024]